MDRHPMPGERAFAPFIIVLGLLVVPLLLIIKSFGECEDAPSQGRHAAALIAQAQEVRP